MYKMWKLAPDRLKKNKIGHISGSTVWNAIKFGFVLFISQSTKIN